MKGKSVKFTRLKDLRQDIDKSQSEIAKILQLNHITHSMKGAKDLYR